MSKEKHIEKALKFIRKTGHSEIKANFEDLEGYEDESPSSFTLNQGQENEDVFTPDFTAYKYGNKSYFEIAMKDEDIQRTVSKWKLLSTMAQMKGGNLYLMAPKGHKAFCENLIKQYRLSVELHYLA